MIVEYRQFFPSIAIIILFPFPPFFLVFEPRAPNTSPRVVHIHTPAVHRLQHTLVEIVALGSGGEEYSRAHIFPRVYVVVWHPQAVVQLTDEGLLSGQRIH